MTKLLNFISKTPVIIALILANGLIGFGFSFFQELVGGTFLDTLYSADAAQTQLAGMNEAQKSTHIRATLLLDILYPLTLGGFLLGIAMRVKTNVRKWVILPSIIAIISDLIENAIHIMALSGNTSLLFLKNILTPLKFFSFYGALLLAVFILMIGLVKWIRRKQ